MEHAAAHHSTDGEPKGTLYVVGTPIGNLRDITLRGLDVLKQVAVIAAEDTRVTAKLLHHYGIASKLTALHGHNEKRAAAPLLALLAQGKSIALVSDAGTPGISDPGARLIAAAHSAGYTVSPVPGASAPVAALSVSGVAARHFLFYGFLPARAVERRNELAGLAAYPFALVFFEAPHRIIESINDMAAMLGATRRVVIARELTKLFETVHACALKEASSWLEKDEHRRKGEFVLVVEGAAPVAGRDEEAQHTLEILLTALPLKQAVTLATRITGAKRNRLYELALQLKSEQGN
jgi:16S rRNA (cytidine1402-2'-O)-methyltransferase